MACRSGAGGRWRSGAYRRPVPRRKLKISRRMCGSRPILQFKHNDMDIAMPMEEIGRWSRREAGLLSSQKQEIQVCERTRPNKKYPGLGPCSESRASSNGSPRYFLFRGLLRGVLLARPKVTTQGCRRVARSAAGLVRANPPTGHHLPSRPSPSAICDLPPAGCCSASHQLAHLHIPWSNSWWQGMPRQHHQMQPQRQPPAGPSAHSPVQFLVPRPAGWRERHDGRPQRVPSRSLRQETSKLISV